MQLSTDRYKPNLLTMQNDWWKPINGANEHGYELYEKEDRWRLYSHYIDDWIFEVEKGSFGLND